MSLVHWNQSHGPFISPAYTQAHTVCFKSHLSADKRAAQRSRFSWEQRHVSIHLLSTSPALPLLSPPLIATQRTVDMWGNTPTATLSSPFYSSLSLSSRTPTLYKWTDVFVPLVGLLRDSRPPLQFHPPPPPLRSQTLQFVVFARAALWSFAFLFHCITKCKTAAVKSPGLYSF